MEEVFQNSKKIKRIVMCEIRDVEGRSKRLYMYITEVS